MTDQELIDYYVALLIVQYRTKQRAQATVASYVSQVIAQQIVDQVGNAFDLTTARGDQLNKLATYRGAPRDIIGIDLSRDYFGMPTYADNPAEFFGFALYGDMPSWQFLQYEDVNQNIYTLSDAELRLLIQLFAKIQSSSLGVGEIDLILFEFFGNNVNLVDNGDMTIDYVGTLSDPSNLFTIVSQIEGLPAPAGVEVSYSEV